MITIAAGLETTNITPDTIIPCGNGRMTLFKRVIRDHNSYPSLTVEDVLAKSSNIGAIQIGLKVGNKRLWEYIKTIWIRHENGNRDARRVGRNAAALAEVASGARSVDRDGSRNHHHDRFNWRRLLASLPTAECS